MSESDVEILPAPLLGQHTAEVLAQKLGLSTDELQSLAAGGVIQARDLPAPAAAGA